MKAGVVSSAIPTASSSPLAPGFVIVVLTERISRFYSRTICADGGMVRGDNVPVPSHCRPCCQDKNHRETENSEFHNALFHRLIPRVLHGIVPQASAQQQRQSIGQDNAQQSGQVSVWSPMPFDVEAMTAKMIRD